MEWLETFRFEYPRVFGWTVGIFCSLFALTVFMSLPESPMLQAIGVTGLQKKVSNFNNAVYWQVRAATNTGGETMAPPKTIYGTMVGIDGTGQMVISVPEGEQFTQRRIRIADTKVMDLYGAAVLIGSLRLENARFDIYPNDQAVIWLRNVPFNVKLIEAGLAMPDPNPPTNIVDTAFAAHYWNQFNGGGSQAKAADGK